MENQEFQLLLSFFKVLLEDCATLRRKLIGYQMMQRKNGVYSSLLENLWKSA